MLTSYEQDIFAEPEALRQYASQPLPSSLRELDLRSYDRIVLSGMGSSYLAAYSSWCRLVGVGHASWWITTSYLLDTPELIGQNTLLWLTSQSGESGETVALLSSRKKGRGPRTVLGFTNDPASTLALSSHVLVELHSGEEASVSTKSFANSLAAHERAVAVLVGADDDLVVERTLAAADRLESFSPDVSSLASRCLDDSRPRVVLVADPDVAPGALFGALVLKEAAKVTAEGYVGGEFRHGPIELAGPGLTAILFGNLAADTALGRLRDDLRRTGALVVGIGTNSTGTHLTNDSTDFELPDQDPLCVMLCAAKFTQLLSVELARLQGFVPGKFLFGSKITSVL